MENIKVQFFMNNIKINKLVSGDIIKVISPSGSLRRDSSVLETARFNLNKLGLEVEYSKNLGKNNAYNSSSIEDRIADLHDAFHNPHIKAVICLTGGFNANDILKYINWDILKNNPKPIIGSSDITVLLNAIHKKTGMKTYFGPNYFKFGMKIGLEYTLDYFSKCLIFDESYNILPSKKWSNDKWYRNQEDRIFYKNNGYKIIASGEARGTIIGGNLCSFNLLQGTEFMPSLSGSVLLIEDDDLVGENCFGEFNRNLQSLLHLPTAQSIKGIILGRFPLKSEIDIKKIKYIIHSKKELKGIPVIANVDFGHTDPIATLPIGGVVEMSAKNNKVTIKITKH